MKKIIVISEIEEGRLDSTFYKECPLCGKSTSAPNLGDLHPVVNAVAVFEEIKKLKEENEKLHLQVMDERAEVVRWKEKYGLANARADDTFKSAMKLFQKLERIKEMAKQDAYPTANHLRSTVLAIVNEP